MNKQVLTDEKLKTTYIQCRHPSGLTILLYPMEGFSTAYALFGTNYGSVDVSFRKKGEDAFTDVPAGIAHYLEHKLFESEDGDAFKLFASTGADANAYTSFDRTCYLFSCTSNFSESLQALLTFVQHPYFTEETVRKEQGIIAQEIRMYDDSPGWRVLFGLLDCLYEHSPVKIDIAGTEESIAQITPELLYTCYHTFYNLNNMVLAIAGHFDPDEALQVIEQNLLQGEPVEIERAPYCEKKEALKKRADITMDVAMPQFYIGYKQQPAADEKSFLRQQFELEILHELLIGSTSDCYERLLREGLINSTFGTEVFCGRGFLVSLFGGESENPEAVQAALCAEIEKRKAAGINEEDFLACKNAIYGRMLRTLHDVEDAATALLSASMSGMTLFESIHTLADITAEDVLHRLQTDFDPDCMAISVIHPRG
jgi:predicted Zn-dependent peptidase